MELLEAIRTPKKRGQLVLAPSYKKGAFDSHAVVSAGLTHWQKFSDILIDVGPAGSVDSRYAHKPGIISRGGTLYHFYCAVAPAEDKLPGEIEHSEVRGISLARS